MPNTKLTCENCGFEEEVSAKKLQERTGQDGSITCSACGASLSLAAPKDSEKTAKNSKKAAVTSNNKMKSDTLKSADTEAGAASEKNEKNNSKTRPPKESTSKIPQVNIYAKADEEAFSKDEHTGNADSSKEQQNSNETRQDRKSQHDLGESAKEKLKEVLCRGRENPLFVAEMLNSLVSKIANSAESRFDRLASASIKLGHYILLATAVLSLVVGVLISLRALSLVPAFCGLALFLLLLIAQYLALKGFALLEGYIDQHASKMPQATLPELLAALAAFSSLVALVTGILLTIDYFSPVGLGLALVGAVGGYFSSAAFMHAGSRLNVSYESSLSAGETAVELIRLWAKSMVAVLPFIFGLGSAAMVACMIWPVVSMLLFGLTQISTVNFFLQKFGLLVCAFSPITTYITILILGLIADILSGLLKFAKDK